MGADIAFYDENCEELFYFRDAYNENNLAWIASLSYWACERNGDDKVEFMEKLSKITDSKIKRYVDRKIKSNCRENYTMKDRINWINYLKETRDDVKKHLSIIKKAKSILWSV